MTQKITTMSARHPTNACTSLSTVRLSTHTARADVTSGRGVRDAGALLTRYRSATTRVAQSFLARGAVQEAARDLRARCEALEAHQRRGAMLQEMIPACFFLSARSYVPQSAAAMTTDASSPECAWLAAQQRRGRLLQKWLPQCHPTRTMPR
jgi:hypothetical protein